MTVSFENALSLITSRAELIEYLPPKAIARLVDRFMNAA